MCQILRLTLNISHFIFTESLQGGDDYTHFTDGDCGSDTFPKNVTWQDVELGFGWASV